MKQLEQKTTEDIRTAGEPNNIHIVNPLGRIEEENIRELQGRLKLTTTIMGDFKCHHSVWGTSNPGCSLKTIS